MYCAQKVLKMVLLKLKFLQKIIFAISFYSTILPSLARIMVYQITFYLIMSYSKHVPSRHKKYKKSNVLYVEFPIIKVAVYFSNFIQNFERQRLEF